MRGARIPVRLRRNSLSHLAAFAIAICKLAAFEHANIRSVSNTSDSRLAVVLTLGVSVTDTLVQGNPV